MLGLAAVVVGHTTTDSYLWLHHLMVAWDVPIFFFISGYLWNEHRSFTDELRRRSRKLLVPYVCWLAISVAECVIWQFPDRPLFPTAEQPLNSVFVQALLGGDYVQGPRQFWGALWFITAMWSGVLIFRWAGGEHPIWRKLAVKAKLSISMTAWLGRPHPLLPWAVGIFGVAWGTFSRETIVAIPEDLGMGLVVVFFMCCGRAFRKLQSGWLGGGLGRPTPGRTALIGLALVVVPLVGAYFEVFDELHPKGIWLGTPVISVAAAVLISAGIVILCQWAEPHLAVWMRKVVAWLGSIGIAIFIGHSVIREVLTSLTGYRDNGLLMFLFCYFGSIALGSLIKLTPLRKYLL
jgi:fucose 4-O-acetylase-like acetyltransferase